MNAKLAARNKKKEETKHRQTHTHTFGSHVCVCVCVCVWMLSCICANLWRWFFVAAFRRKRLLHLVFIFVDEKKGGKKGGKTQTDPKNWKTAKRETALAVGLGEGGGGVGALGGEAWLVHKWIKMPTYLHMLKI